jgi:hypothetical protein
VGDCSGSLNTAGTAQPPLRTTGTKGDRTRDIQLTGSAIQQGIIIKLTSKLVAVSNCFSFND